MIIDEAASDFDNNLLPDEILANIFRNFDLETRLNCCLVCKRWYFLLTSENGDCQMPGIAVLNIFEEAVWESKSLAQSAKTKVNSVKVSDPEKMEIFAKHAGGCNSVKLWFKNEQFLNSILRVLSRKNFKMRCLDLYPFHSILPLNVVSVYLPRIEAVILRPHGPEYFWKGMPLNEFPALEQLDTLIMDSINLHADIQFPTSLTQLEWSHRDDSSFLRFLNKVADCPNLKYLFISHVQFDEYTQGRLFEVFGHLRELIIVGFKFVRFARTEAPYSESPPPLKIIKFDLCYGDLLFVLKQFMNYAPKLLQIINVNTIFEENQLNTLFSLMPKFKQENLWLQLGVLQRQTNRERALLPRRRAFLQGEQANGENHELNPEDDSLLIAYPPLEFRYVLCKLELSFIEEKLFLQRLLSCGLYDKLLEAKFIQCAALTDENMAVLAKSCLRLRKLQITDCVAVDFKQICYFFDHWSERKSKFLSIVWRTESNLNELVDYVKNTYTELNVDCYRKILPNTFSKGLRIAAWDSSASPKLLTVQNYMPTELSAIFGFVVPGPTSYSPENPEAED